MITRDNGLKLKRMNIRPSVLNMITLESSPKERAEMPGGTERRADSLYTCELQDFAPKTQGGGHLHISLSTGVSW